MNSQQSPPSSPGGSSCPSLVSSTTEDHSSLNLDNSFLKRRSSSASQASIDWESGSLDLSIADLQHSSMPPTCSVDKQKGEITNVSRASNSFYRSIVLLFVIAVTLVHLSATKQLIHGLSKKSTLEENFKAFLTDASIPQHVQDQAHQAQESFSGEKFDYEAFWEKSVRMALDKNAENSLQQDINAAAMPCPKVFMYNLSSAFKDTDSNRTLSRSHAFGRVSIEGWEGHLRDTVQHHAGVIFEHRLSQPESCYHTTDPSEADLFFVPVLLARKKASEWASICKNLDTNRLMKELVHLSPETECKHFFVFPKGHYSGDFCKGWFTEPHPRLKNAARLAYSHVPGRAEDPELVYFNRASPNPEKDGQRHPNLVSIPYPSSLHWYGNSYYSNLTEIDESALMDQAYEQAQFNSTANYSQEISDFSMPIYNQTEADRPYLMSFVGRFDHGDVPVRTKIQDQCESYRNQSKCHLPSSVVQRRSSLPSQDILVKAQSIFCLEPAGDSPWRKSLADSITFGCIPVLFSDLSDDVTPWHWGEWKHQGRVLIDRDLFLSGRIDLHTLLSTIPEDFRAEMQQTLRKHARQYQYSFRDDPQDAFHLTMTKLKERSDSLVATGQCGRR